jgi:hypothetical protein
LWHLKVHYHFQRAHHRILSWASSNESKPSLSISVGSTQILLPHLWLCLSATCHCLIELVWISPNFIFRLITVNQRMAIYSQHLEMNKCHWHKINFGKL